MAEDTGAGGRRKYQAATGRLRAGFTAMPNAVLMSRELSGNAKTLYALMCHCVWSGDEPELPELGELIAAGEKVARRAIRELETAGLVESKRRGQGRTNAYIVHEPETQNGQIGRSRSSETADPTRAGATAEDEVQDREAEAKASTSRGGSTKKTRKRDVVFDAIAAATQADPAVEGGRIAKAKKLIVQAWAETRRAHEQQFLAANPSYDELPEHARATLDGILAAEIQRRAKAYTARWPGAELTPTALARNWTRVTLPKPGEAGQAAWEWALKLAAGKVKRDAMSPEGLRALQQIGDTWAIKTATKYDLERLRQAFLDAYAGPEPGGDG